MQLIVGTSQIRYRGPGRLDITRGSGSGFGLAFAPTYQILRPALAARHEAEGLEKAADTLETDDPCRASMLVEAKKLEDQAWARYQRQYFAELLVSGGRPVPPGWAKDVAAARERGVEPFLEAWWMLPELAGPDGVLVGCCYCSARYVAIGHCHRVLWASVLGRLGAVVRGEM